MVAVTCVNEPAASYHSTALIQKEKKVYVKHDQLFRELINNFFAEFLEVFFPDIHSNIDFKSIKPLSEELFTDLISGQIRRVAIVIEAKLKGEDTLLIVHVEPQSTFQKSFISACICISAYFTTNTENQFCQLQFLATTISTKRTVGSQSNFQLFMS